MTFATPYVPRQYTPLEGTPFVLSGTCNCGHSYLDHHEGGLAKQVGGCPAECEFWGSNETGGQMPTDSGHWVRHCSGYCDADEPDPKRQEWWRTRHES